MDFYIFLGKRKARFAFLMTLALFGVLLNIYCSKEKKPSALLKQLVAQSKPTNVKVLLVGIDGQTFDVMDPMIKEGKLPHMKKLIRNGSYGILKSYDPMKSPSIWTTIVTGRRRGVHGILDFYSRSNQNRNKKVLITSNDRQISAIWNWVGLFGKTVGFAGWWASWPAETVNGWIISDRITRSRFNEWTGGRKYQALTYPPELMEEFWPMIVDPSEPPLEEIHEMVQFTEDELNEFHAASMPIFSHGLSVFKFAYCSQLSYEKMVLHMLNKEQPDLTGVYLIANDPICHTFWHYYEPDKFENVDPEKANRLGKLIPSFYEHNDRYLAQLLDKVDSKTVVMVVSDHGFQASGVVPEQVSAEEFEGLKKEAIKKETVTVGQAGIHHLNGVLIAWGRPIKKGFKIQNASVFDITPTILALMGLPVPEDMDGRVLTEIFDPLFQKNHPIQTCSSFKNYFDRQKIEVSTDIDEKEILDKLRALGYIE